MHNACDTDVNPAARHRHGARVLCAQCRILLIVNTRTQNQSEYGPPQPIGFGLVDGFTRRQTFRKIRTYKVRFVFCEGCPEFVRRT